MDWTDVTQNWPLWSRRIRARFPSLDQTAMTERRHDRSAFEAYLAHAHNLSLNEAHEEMDDFLYFEALSRELAQPACAVATR